ncbi:uracil-DNA glycosylase [Candidatus Woesearchaeota archaeon CG10_big_fil_rev_8_21_14_0_10_36_11]|nr:MAG: uracil-DNA glycosylase [Candidatus Woesearchaeota archaeon CG10_big_fil_rev_8_21_14_0_10_36_11]
MTNLFSLAEQIRKCTACPLWKKRTLTVPGEGPENADILFVGEAPGVEEDRKGLPFVGKSGTFLDEMIQIIGITKKDVFITNCVKCRPPNNRKPTGKELETCTKLWLEKQIVSIKPKVIVILGRVALQSVLKKTNIHELHGKVITKNKQKYFITYHPVAGMRFPATFQKIKSDCIKLVNDINIL